MSQLAPTQFAQGTARPATLSYWTVQLLAAALDVGLMVISCTIGYCLYNYYISGEFNSGEGVSIGITTGVIFAELARSHGLYEIPALLTPGRHLRRLSAILVVSVLILIGISFLLKDDDDYSRGSVIVFVIFAILFVLLGRLLLARLSAVLIEWGVIVGRRAVVIGEPAELGKLASSDLRHFGVEEVVRIGVAEKEDGEGLSDTSRAWIKGAIGLARQFNAAGFVLIVSWGDDRLLAEIGDLLRPSPLPVRLIPDFKIRNIYRRQNNGDLDARFTLEIQREPLSRWERMAKRSLDLALSLSALVVLSPLLLITAAAVKLDSKGPVLFRQRRSGFDNKLFVIYKFRTMTVLDDGDQVVQARRGDRRVTRIGRLLRRSSIDELPQLFNVIRGEMSLVGPRPHALAHNDQYGALIGSYALRHHVKPGLTGLAQVCGLRGETRQLVQMEKRVEQDLWYINHWSLTLDLKIMARTCVALLRNDVY